MTAPVQPLNFWQKIGAALKKVSAAQWLVKMHTYKRRGAIAFGVLMLCAIGAKFRAPAWLIVPLAIASGGYILYAFVRIRMGTQ